MRKCVYWVSWLPFGNFMHKKKYKPIDFWRLQRACIYARRLKGLFVVASPRENTCKVIKAQTTPKALRNHEF